MEYDGVGHENPHMGLGGTSSRLQGQVQRVFCPALTN